jgi:hypothetical protein
MKKFLFFALLAWTALPLAAKPAPDFYFEGYENVPLPFLREHYTDLENGRPIKFDGWYKSHEWMPLYQYQQQLKDSGLSIREFNVVKFSFKEDVDSIHYSFPILLFRALKGDVSEFKGMAEGTHMAVYGRFFNLKNNEWAVAVDTVEVIERDGLDKHLISDYRMAPTPTPTATVTPTPGPSMLQQLWNKVNPKESATPSGTITPDASGSPTPDATVAASVTPSPVVKAVSKKTTAHKHHKRHKAVKKAAKAKLKAKSTPSSTLEATVTPTPNA